MELKVWLDYLPSDGALLVRLPCGHVFSKSVLENRFSQEGYYEENRCPTCNFRLFTSTSTLIPWHKFPVALGDDMDCDVFVETLERVDPRRIHAIGGTCDFCLHRFGVRDRYV